MGSQKSYLWVCTVLHWQSLQWTCAEPRRSGLPRHQSGAGTPGASGSSPARWRSTAAVPAPGLTQNTCTRCKQRQREEVPLRIITIFISRCHYSSPFTGKASILLLLQEVGEKNSTQNPGNFSLLTILFTTALCMQDLHINDFSLKHWALSSIPNYSRKRLAQSSRAEHEAWKVWKLNPTFSSPLKLINQIQLEHNWNCVSLIAIWKRQSQCETWQKRHIIFCGHTE